MHFYTGDTPLPVSIEPVSVEDAGYFTFASAELINPAGLAVAVDTEWDLEHVTVTLPILSTPGRYEIRVVLSKGGRLQSLPPVPVIVESEDGDGWHTLASARGDWDGAPNGDDDEDARLYDLLEVAREQVLAFAPKRQDTDPVPTRYKQAQIMQARNLWNALGKNPVTDQQGFGEFSLPTFPLDWNVRALIRPIRAVPVVG